MSLCHSGFDLSSSLSVLRISIATVSLLAMLLHNAPAAPTAPLEPKLVKNIHTGESERSEFQTDYHIIARVNDRCLVSIPSFGYGQELWVSDDTAAGMHLLADIYPGPSSSNPNSFTPNAEGSRVFFTATDRLNGNNLWVTDGTVAGTLRLTDPLNAAKEGISPYAIRPFRDGVLFHSSYDGNQIALWFSDGTVTGTRPLVVVPILYRSGSIAVFNWMIAGDVSYVWALGDTESELWRTDGTVAGTRRLGVFPWASVELFHALGDRLFFTAGDAKKGWQIWTTDGTAEGTRSLRALDRNPDSPLVYDVRKTENRLYLLAQTQKDGIELWSTDGTVAGTGIVKNLAPGKASADISVLGTVGNRLCFTAKAKSYGREFWITDGTPKGTEMKDLNPGKGDSNITFPISLGSRLYFRAWNGIHDDLWTTDGTMAGTVLAASFFPERKYINPRDFYVRDGSFSFVSQVDETDKQTLRVWHSGDGTPGGIQPVLTDVSQLAARKVKSLVRWNGKFLVPYGEIDSSNAIGPVDLLSHDPGTGVTENLFTGPVSDFTWRWLSSTRAVFSYRTSSSPDAKIGLSSTDGTAVDTSFLAEIPINLAGTILTTADKMWFMGLDPSQGGRITLWKTDGTAAGTVAARLPAAPDGDSFPSDLASLGDLAIFTANDGILGYELWRSDGTEAGTFMLKDITPGSSSNPLTIHGTYAGLLYFTATTANRRNQLWRSDGTEAGTFMLMEIGSRLSSPGPSEFTVMNGTVFFIAPGAGKEVWRTDGAVAGTRQATNILYNYSKEAPRQLTYFQGRLYFIASGTSVTSIWSTDGTPQGTVSLSLDAYGFSRFPVNSDVVLKAAGEFLYWVDNTGLYRTDGPQGTRTLLTTGDFTSSSLIVRPPTPGAAVSPDRHVVFLVRNSKLLRCSNDEAAAVEVCPTPGGSLHLCGDRVVFTENSYSYYGNSSSLWSSDGTPGSKQRLLPNETSPTLLASTAQRLYCTYTDAKGRLNLEFVRPDGSGRNMVLQAGHKDTFHLESIEGEHVVFRMELWKSITESDHILLETSGTLESTRQFAVMSAILRWSGIKRVGSRLFLAIDDPAAGRELHTLAFEGPPTLTLSQSAEQPTLEMGEDDVIELPPQVLHHSRVCSLQVRNTALQPLTDVTFSSPGLPDFEVTPGSIPSLAQGEVAEIQITFTPQQVGLRETSVQFSSTLGTAAFTRTLHLRGRGLALDAAPENLIAPGSRLVLAGQPVSLAADIITPAGITTAGWQRTPGTALAETGPVLTLPAAQADDVGVYTYHVSTPTGEVTTPPASLGVVTPVAHSQLRVASDKSFELTCTAQAPPGSTLSYQWTFNQYPLRSGGRIQGSQTARLRIDKLDRFSDIGFYECLVTLHAEDRSVTLSHGRTQIIQLLPPEIINNGNEFFYIGQSVQFQVPTSQSADFITLKGLPPGLTANSVGLITGRPTKVLPMDPATGLPRLYPVTAVAGNAAGNGPPGIVFICVMSVAIPGTYHGLIDRSEALAGSKNLGGSIALTVSSSGGFSGQLVHGGKTYRFTLPRLAAEVPQDGAAVNYEIPILLAPKLPPLRLLLGSLGVESDPYATLIDDSGISTSSFLERQASRSSIGGAEAAGIYNVLLSPRPAQPGDAEPTPPIGSNVPGAPGYLVVNVANSGTATCKGKLADGTAITGSCPIVRDSDPLIYLHSPFNKITGSLHGYMVPYKSYIRSSNLTWMKAPDGNRSYGDGIHLHRLNAEGYLWVKPDRYNLFWDLQYIGYNLKINLTGPGLPEEGILQYAGISPANRVSLPLKIPGNIMQKLSIYPTTGLFKGSFRLYAIPGLNKPPKPVDIPFEGAFVSSGPARGFFLIPELTEEGFLTKDAPLQSGTIEFIPNTPD